MKLCRTCRYGSDYELDKPCIVYREDCPLYEKEGDEMNREEAIEVIKQDIPCEYDTDLIEALEMAIKALEQDNCPYYVIDEDGHGLCKNHSGLHLSQRFKDWQFIQEPKMGHWIEKDGFDGDTYYDCSECGESWTTIEGTPWNNEWNYCPNCGARMADCHTCKHYTSGEYDGSCDSYICEQYSGWEREDKE